MSLDGSGRVNFTEEFDSFSPAYLSGNYIQIKGIYLRNGVNLVPKLIKIGNMCRGETSSYYAEREISEIGI